MTLKEIETLALERVTEAVNNGSYFVQDKYNIVIDGVEVGYFCGEPSEFAILNSKFHFSVNVNCSKELASKIFFAKASRDLDEKIKQRDKLDEEIDNLKSKIGAAK